MANLFFPQLTNGSLAQYPIKKTKLIRTIQNVFPDGTLIQLPDTPASMVSWQLAYTELSPADLNAIQGHFEACAGALRAFTFIDPTDNMLACSSDLTASVWVISGNIRVENGIADPNGGSQAFQLTNIGQTNATIGQSLIVPSNYQYCFSVFISSNTPSRLSVALSGSSTTLTQAFTAGQQWNRVACNTRLNDPGTIFTAALQIEAGQQIQVFGPQLEAQIAPSQYRATAAKGGVYPKAHFTGDYLPVVAEAPSLFATSLMIESVA